MKRLIIIIWLLSSAGVQAATEFEELDKPPEGAHKGQIFLGMFFSIGKPVGKLIKAENSFLKGTTYTFLNSGVTKQMLVNHLGFSYGLLFEYMPIDYLGIKIKLKSSEIVQQSSFGAQYENWTRKLYNDYSFLLGPSLHLVNRKAWDISLTPSVGYALGKLSVTPIATKLLAVNGYTGSHNRKADNLVLGSELNLTAFISGGLFISIGFDWTMNMVKFGKPFYLTNPQTTLLYFPGATAVNIHSLSFIFSVGYAFSN